MRGLGAEWPGITGVFSRVEIHNMDISLESSAGIMVLNDVWALHLAVQSGPSQSFEATFNTLMHPKFGKTNFPAPGACSVARPYENVPAFKTHTNDLASQKVGSSIEYNKKGQNDRPSCSQLQLKLRLNKPTESSGS